MKTNSRSRLITSLMCIAVCVTWLSFSGPSVSGKGKPTGGGNTDTNPSFDIIELDNAGGAVDPDPRDINNKGITVGSVTFGDETFAACWTLDTTGETVTSTLHLLGGLGSSARSINDAGEIVGVHNDAAVYWENKDSDPIVLPVPDGSSFSVANSINNNGVICGLAQSYSDPSEVALVWRINFEIVDGQSKPTVRGPLVLPKVAASDFVWASGISDNNDDSIAIVVGGSFDGETTVDALSWTVVCRPDGSLGVGTGPKSLGRAYANSVNKSGAICGELLIEYAPLEGVVWDSGSLDVLDRAKNITGSVSAREISNKGVIVGSGLSTDWRTGYGYRACVWPSSTGPMVLLQDSLRKSSSLLLEHASAVNDFDMIVGDGWDSKRELQVGFLAIPKSP